MEVTRNEFLRCCAAGVCGCVAGLPAPATAETPAATLEQLQWQLDAARVRYAKLVSLMEENLDEATRKRILDGLGSALASSAAGPSTNTKETCADS